MPTTMYTYGIPISKYFASLYQGEHVNQDRNDFKLNRANQKRDGDDATLYERSPSGGSPLSYVGKDYLW